MIPVSNATKQTIANGTVYVPSVDITLAGASTPISLTSADIWDGGIVIENAISNESSLDVGSVMISKATVTINNIDGTYDHTDFSDAVVAIYLTVGSETFSRGRYTVDTQTFNGGLVTLTCLDFMEKTERPASDLPTITYPTTIGTIVGAIASTCGLTLDDAQFTGYNFPITAAIDMTNLSCRDVLHYLVQICGANAWMSYDNKLVIRWYEIAEDASADPTPGDTIFSYESLPSGTVYTDGFSFTVGNTYMLSFGNKLLSGTATGSASSREVEFADGTDRMVIVQLKNDFPQTYYTTEFRAYSSAFDNGFTVSEAVHVYAIPHPYALTAAIDKTVITGVRVIVNTDSDSETDPSTITYVSGTDDFAIQIESNPFINTDNYQTVAANIGANVVGLEYYRANASVIGNAILETGDIITISNRKGTAYPIIVSSVTYTVNDKTRIVSASEEPARNSANRLSEATKTYIRAREAALKPALTALDQAKDDLNARISASPGLYTTEITDSQGATTFYLHDKSTLATSTIIWRMTAEAWGVSTNGGQSYDYGMTVDGNVIANILSATGINADWINTGVLKALYADQTEAFSIDVPNKSITWNMNNTSLNEYGNLKLQYTESGTQTGGDITIEGASDSAYLRPGELNVNDTGMMTYQHFASYTSEGVDLTYEDLSGSGATDRGAYTGNYSAKGYDLSRSGNVGLDTAVTGVNALVDLTSANGGMNWSYTLNGADHYDANVAKRLLQYNGVPWTDLIDPSGSYDLANIGTELSSKAPLASPALTGTPTAPTQAAGNNSTRIATTAFVHDNAWNMGALIPDNTDLNTVTAPGLYYIVDSASAATMQNIPTASSGGRFEVKSLGSDSYRIQLFYIRSSDNVAPFARYMNVYTGNYTSWHRFAFLDSPTFTGTPKAPTAAAGTNTTQIATTAFVQTALNNRLGALGDIEFHYFGSSSGATWNLDFGTDQPMFLLVCTVSGQNAASRTNVYICSFASASFGYFKIAGIGTEPTISATAASNKHQLTITAPYAYYRAGIVRFT